MIKYLFWKAVEYIRSKVAKLQKPLYPDEPIKDKRLF